MKNEAKHVPEADVTISSRIRLARNIENYPFTIRMSRTQSTEVLEKARDALFCGKSAGEHSFSYLDLQSLTPLDKQFLVEKHLISPEFTEGDISRAVIISKDEKISIMVNEEDHIRLQCIFPGMQVKEAWKLCNKLDSEIEEKLEYAFDKSNGYLTCCPTNIGTGMRASIMLHLPALSMTGYIKDILETCGKVGVAVRGAYGENTDAAGNMFQVSNQVTLGQTEEEIIAGISNITSQISEQERKIRSEIYKQNPVLFEDRIFRSWGILKNARIISSEESLKLLSDVRLGLISGLITGLEVNKLNEMMLMIQPACLQKFSGGQMSPDKRDQRRAELLRKNLGGGIQ